ncbi:MAG: hexokinase [Spirochaetaceae bacterium]|nr:hexokinase [Spirochaetaceae bacterium]
MSREREMAMEFLGLNFMQSAQVDMESLSRSFIDEMEKGLKGELSSLFMLPTYIEAKSAIPSNRPVIALDAGGTNFRVALVVFDDEKKPLIKGFRKFPMPGVKGEVGLEEFFACIATAIGDLIPESDDIGFCFSYPTEIMENGDGRLLRFSKEINAKEVEGQMIGENLNKALLARGMNKPKNIVIVNDTVTTLLAGMSAFADRNFDSYIGFILGTGTNCCYSEKNSLITKIKGVRAQGEQVINIESGGFGRSPRGLIDREFDETTLNPGFYTFEKMISGAYLGGLFTLTLKSASRAGLFSAGTAASIDSASPFTTSDMGAFLADKEKAGSVHNLMAKEGELAIAFCIAEEIVDRAARLSAVNLASIAIKTGKGFDPLRPVLTAADGTTFYELPGLRQKTLRYIDSFLRVSHGQYMEFARVDNASLIGAAIAGLR